MLGHVVADPFEAGHVEVAFAEVERETVFDIDFTDAFKEVEEKGGVVGPHETVVNNLFAVNFLGTVGKTGAEKLVRFFADLAHDGCVNGWGIDGTEGHDLECVLEPVGGKEGELFSVRFEDGNLVEARLGVETDEENFAARSIAKVIKGVVATGNGEQERKSDSIKRTVIDAKAPNEVIDVIDMFLVGFGSEEAFT